MLDTFEILTTSGVVLWSKQFSPVSPAVINSLITNVFIEERTLPGAGVADDVSAARNPPFKHDQHTLKWTTCKELGLIFVVVYRSLLHLSWIDKLVDNVKTIFVDLYGDQLRKPHTTVVECPFDEYFDQQVRELEKSALNQDARVAESSAFEESIPLISTTSDDEPPPLPGSLSRGTMLKKSLQPNRPLLEHPISRPSTPASHILSAKAGPGGKVSRRARKAAQTPTYASSGDESHKKVRSAKSGPKKGRKWDAEGMVDEDSDTPLDYSAPANGATSGEDEARPGAVEGVEQTSWGSKTGKGHTPSTGLVGSSFSAIGGLFRNVVGGKTLTKEDLDKAMKGMEDHLLRKNVAREAAMRLCEGVERELIGVKTGSFESVQAKIATAMESSLRKILTPTSSLDLLREIDAVVSPAALSLKKKRPYVMSIVGVNGVGKSTNLSKICYFLLQNKYKVLVVACDTFRSGAVEQLAVHVRNLKELTAREGGQRKTLFSFAAQEGYDVVLIDTAGRRHNDQRLMSSLEKILPSLLNLTKFSWGRSLDGFIISKCDTVGDMVGTLVSMVHATNVPVLFVGVGQHYSDLRNLSVKWAVEKLMAGN
ncbi:hypothetical protein EYC84_001179 [Monilinia fructicola]|uniref:SRP54-type proteins GTP-binding domain-containing protein n=1 Tax=Monilinia fructicola TaxID=38448 RepID=A0A5M9JP63_MONFR|nr:hypothetical protein EYC84_001179 [Monilinia fructicola]